MEFLIILCLCLLACSKVMVQSFFAKKNVVTLADGVFFNGCIFFFAAILFLSGAYFHLSVVCFALIFGILTVAFQLCYVNALSKGNVSLTVLIVNMSMIIPIATSVLFFDAPMTVFRYIGMVLAIIALVFNVNPDRQITNFKKWLFFCLAAFLANSGLSVCQQFFSRYCPEDSASCFVAWSYLFATLISVPLYFLFAKKKSTRTFPIKPPVFCFALLAGILLGVFQRLNTYAVATIDGTLLFPAYNVGTLTLSSLSSVLLYKERLKAMQIISILAGAFAIILINL